MPKNHRGNQLMHIFTDIELAIVCGVSALTGIGAHISVTGVRDSLRVARQRREGASRNE